MPQRYNVDIDGLTGFVELGDVWSYGELRQVDGSNDADLMTFISRKMIAVELPTVGGNSISSEDAFTERWQEMDMRLYNWMLSVTIQERSRIGALGEAILQESLKSFVAAAVTKATPASQDK